ncbi:hypothetical protein TL16_g02756 [Triparma laevis f. inornata]|uniref:CHK kinase-like domain-containing protein n=1 Tax=Triparma laevis f. inornata TaxID=1714386 RepID=A0A9W6ZVD1_9STRA|nr:hypothetical protein TL16_g02756 [Triparma laevis f. inornata]
MTQITPQPTHVPETLDEITLLWLQEILANNPLVPNSKLIACVNRTKATGGFFVGGNSSVAVFDLEYEEGESAEEGSVPASVCVKLMPKESLVPRWLLKRFWKAEVFFYKNMRGGFPQPNCYYCDFVGDKAVVVMNEMTKNPIYNPNSMLEPGDSTRDLTYAEACLSLVILAKFHAKWWGAKDKKLDVLGRFNSAESGITCKFLMGGAQHMLGIPEYEPIHGLVRAMQSKVKAVFKYLKRGPFTVTHGDSRSDNFFYRSHEHKEGFNEAAYNRIVDRNSGRDGSTSETSSVTSGEGGESGESGSERHSIESSLNDQSEAALCDFQMIMVSNPMRDYANFVVNSLSPVDRRKWSDKLIRVYHQELIKCGVPEEEYSYDQALEDSKVMFFWPMLCNISIAEKSANSFRKYEEMEKNGEELSGKERANYILLKKTRPRLISAAKDAGLLEMLEGRAKDPPLPFIPCCCCWGC